MDIRTYATAGVGASERVEGLLKVLVCLLNRHLYPTAQRSVFPKTILSYPPDRNEQEGGMSFPKRGKSFPRYSGRGGADGSGGPPEEINFANEIAAALDKMLRDGEIRIKTVAAWTGANERTVKNWVSGQYGPCGSHLMVLMRHSDEVLESVLSMAGLHELRLVKKLTVMEQHMQELASMIRALNQESEP